MIIGAAAVAIAIEAALISSGLVVFAQQQQQAPSPPLIPGAALELTPAQAAAVGAHGPSEAQIAHDIASHKADHDRTVAILNEFYRSIGKDTSQAHIAAVLQQMQLRHPGVVHCPGNQISQCYGLSRAPGVPNNISPPIAP